MSRTFNGRKEKGGDPKWIWLHASRLPPRRKRVERVYENKNAFFMPIRKPAVQPIIRLKRRMEAGKGLNPCKFVLHASALIVDCYCSGSQKSEFRRQNENAGDGI